MQELVDKTNIVRFELIKGVRSGDTMDNENKLFILRVTGNVENVENFKILFNYQLAEYGEMKKLREQFKGLVGGTVRSSYNQRRRFGGGGGGGGRRFSDVLKNRD
ncbi:hypothetical protein BLA29_013153 [Euroglyphus maynei]|uniref:Uncharacterized protein n=1 Tax=Euroglyphus maynei TaxID=6958 RepID=A0A1Y3AYN7_EURMA|nr:hypothetical protein BLA29_013153 [Euroglyphus maynei]